MTNGCSRLSASISGKQTTISTDIGLNPAIGTECYAPSEINAGCYELASTISSEAIGKSYINTETVAASTVSTSYDKAPSIRASVVCSLANDLYLRISPELIWVHDWGTVDNLVFSNVVWNIN